MKHPRYYFMLNKRLDYEKSAMENMEYDETGFYVAENSVRNRGVFLSKLFDSREQEMEWHRLVLKVNDTSDAPFQVKVYTSEEQEIVWQGEYVDLSGWIRDTNISMDEKLKACEPYLKKMQMGGTDILLHEVKGRYLWFSIEVYKQFGQELKFQRVTAYFPKSSWLSYLPELYEASDEEHFLDHYLSVFQSVYDDMNERIAQFPYLLDMETTNAEYLDFMCQWVGVVKSQMWPEEKKRKLLSQAARLFQIRGTREGILEVLRLYLGEEVYLVEKHQWKQYEKSAQRNKLYESLYGSSSYMITVLVKEEQVPSRKEYQTFLEVIQTVKPAQAELNLVVLKPYLFLDEHCYLGINSYLGQYRQASLDGTTVLSLAVIGGKQEKERRNHEEY